MNRLCVPHKALLVLMKLELLRRLSATLEERVTIVDHMQWRAPGGLSAFGADRRPDGS